MREGIEEKAAELNKKRMRLVELLVDNMDHQLEKIAVLWAAGVPQTVRIWELIFKATGFCEDSNERAPGVFVNGVIVRADDYQPPATRKGVVDWLKGKHVTALDIKTIVLDRLESMGVDDESIVDLQPSPNDFAIKGRVGSCPFRPSPDDHVRWVEIEE